MKELEATVQESDSGSRLWKFVMLHWKTIVQSREQMRKCFKRGEVFVNNSTEPAEVTKILTTGDIVLLKFNTRAAHESIYGREKLTVLFEDEELAVVVKPSGKTMVTLGYMLPFSLKPSTQSAKSSNGISGAGKDETDDMDIHLPDQTVGEIEDEDEDEDDKESEFQVQQNVSPTVGQQRIPCAIHGLEKASNGPVLVAKTTEMRSTLLKMHNNGEIRRIFRVMCHGTWKSQQRHQQQETDNNPDSGATLLSLLEPGSTLPIDPDCLDAKCINHIRIVTITESNAAEYITTLEIEPISPFLGINVRRYLMSNHHPVIGNSGNSKPLKANRDKGLCSAVVHLEFVHPTTLTSISLDLEEPTKFEQLRTRETRACERRKASDLEELRKGGLADVQSFDRKNERPIAYIVGEKEFCGMRFKVSPATLIPRSSTETLVKAALSVQSQRDKSKSKSNSNSSSSSSSGGVKGTNNVKVLDVGTGSGCLLLAILHSIPGSTGLGVDISQEALEVAQVNSKEHNLSERASFQIADMGKLEESPQLLQSFDILVCNPPYLDSNKSAKLTSTFVGTAYEPSVALFAEKEGYGAYEMLAESLQRNMLSAPSSSRSSSSGKKQPPQQHLEEQGSIDINQSTILAPHGRVILEIGNGMGRRVREIFSFLKFECAISDNQDCERCLVFSVS